MSHIAQPSTRRPPLSLRVIAALSLFAAGAVAQTTAPDAQEPPPSLQAALGKALFFDTTLSTPEGQGCSSCHAPSAGFRFPDSTVNAEFGVTTGVIPGRFTSRSAPTISYAAFIPKGPPGAHLLPMPRSLLPPAELVFVGGMFWDGHAKDLADQASFPFQSPNEMNDVLHGVGSPALVVQKVAAGPSAQLFKRVFGRDIFQHPTAEVFADVAKAIAAYERTEEVSPFTSRYDAFVLGHATLTPEEMDGLRIVTGTTDGTTAGPPFRKNALCLACHGIEDHPQDGPTLWSFMCYANIGTPRNAKNPFYKQVNQHTNPGGYNPLGENFVDFGLGDFIYPLNNLPNGNQGPGSNGIGDFLAANGAFKAPTLRNVDKRPAPDFVKAYMHNGVFKSLKEVVHFYNTRNLTTVPGEVIDYTQHNPFANLQGTPLWPLPEVISPTALVNPEGLTAEEGGMVGNLGLTDAEEDHVVAFLQTLTDGYFEKNPWAAKYLSNVQEP